MLPELVDRCLSYDGLSISVLRLWMTGNRPLQQLLARSVSRIQLEDRSQFSLMRLPKIILSFTALREVCFNRDSHGLIYYKEAFDWVKGLPPTIRKLELRWHFADELMPHFKEDDASPTSPPLGFGPNWSLGSAFPHLETLELYNRRTSTVPDFSALPATLTALTISHFHKPYVASLPRQLLRLRIRGAPKTPEPDFLRDLPPHLTDLYLHWQLRYTDLQGDVAFRSSVLRSFPRNLTQLPILYGFPMASLCELPPAITSLSLLGEQEALNVDLSQLTPHLKQLETSMDLPPSTRASLPHSLTSILISVTSSDKSPYRWPKGLTELTLDDVTMMFDFTMLPSWLRRLTLSQIKTSNIALLPRKLDSLTVGLEKFSEKIDFPPSLTLLLVHFVDPDEWITYERSPLGGAKSGADIPEDDDSDSETLDPSCVMRVAKCFPYEMLPPTIIDLEMEAVIPASKFKFLPPRLRSLHMERILVDYDFNGTDKAEVEKMVQNFEFGEREGICEYALPHWRQLTHASVLTLLPRTLKTLTLSTGGSFSFEPDWKELPPELHTFCMLTEGGTPLSSAIGLPLKYMQNLDMRIHSADDELLIATPKLRRPNQQVEFIMSPLLTPRVLRCLPRHCLTQDNSKELFKASIILADQRERHALDVDPTEFIKLMKLEEDQSNAT